MNPKEAIYPEEQKRQKQLINPEELINKYTEGNPELRHILLEHSKDVAKMALRIIDKLKQDNSQNDTHSSINRQFISDIDRQFIWEAAMLHDIGIVKTDAAGIHCFGKEHYLRHGVLGAEILRKEGLPKHARVAERHTGTGLTAKSIREQKLPLPEVDLCPETLEEQLICYADKFFSKTSLGVEKPIEKVRRSLLRFGEDGLVIFDKWYELFGT